MNEQNKNNVEEKIIEIFDKYTHSHERPWLDAVVKYCTDNDLDGEEFGKKIPKSIKEKIEYEASKFNILKKKYCSNVQLF